MINNSSSVAIEQLDTDSNFILGAIAGGVAMVLSAVIWGAVTYFTQYQIGYMAIGVGFLVGIAVRFFGKGHSLIFGLTSAVFSLIGCVLGNYLFYIGAIARDGNAPFFEVLFYFSFRPMEIVDLFTVAFEFMDLLFYGIAAYIGFRTALDTPQSVQRPQIQQ